MNNEIDRLKALLMGGSCQSLSAKLLDENHSVAKVMREFGMAHQSLYTVVAAFNTRDADIRRLTNSVRVDVGAAFSKFDIGSAINLINGNSDFTHSLEQVLGTNNLRFEFAREAEDRMRLWSKQLGDIDSIAARQFASINLNVADELWRASVGINTYSALLDSVHAIALPTLDFEFSERLGSTFRVDEFCNLSRADDIRRYLARTQLPEAFVEANPELVNSSLTYLGLVAPLRSSQTQRSTPRRLKASQRKRNALSFRELIEWFENALRDKVDFVMQEREGADWIRKLKSPVTKGWVTRFDKKQITVWTDAFAPQREIDSAQFSDFLTFAFLSDHCAPLLLIEQFFPSDELKVEISRLSDARAAVFHGYARTTPHLLTITMGIVYKLAGAAGLTVPLTQADLEKNTDL